MESEKKKNLCCMDCRQKCERICVEGKRIFDICVHKIQSKNIKITVLFPKFAESENLKCFRVENSGGGIVSDIEFKKTESGVLYNYILTVPLRVYASDIDGAVIKGVSSVTFSREAEFRAFKGNPEEFDFEVSCIFGGECAGEEKVETVDGTEITIDATAEITAKITAQVLFVVPACACSVIKKRPRRVSNQS